MNIGNRSVALSVLYETRNIRRHRSPWRHHRCLGWAKYLTSKLHDDANAERSVFGLFSYDTRIHGTDYGCIHVCSESYESLHMVAHDKLRFGHASSRSRNVEWSDQCDDAMVVTLWRCNAGYGTSDALQWLGHAEEDDVMCRSRIERVRDYALGELNLHE